LPHFFNGNFTEIAELKTFMSGRLRQHALLQPSLDEELSKFVGVDVS